MSITATQLAQGRFSQNYRSGVPHPFDDESVFVRVKVFEQQRSQGGRHPQMIPSADITGDCV